MSNPTNTLLAEDNLRLIKIAREIASDMRPLPDILKAYLVTDAEWERISSNSHFRNYLASAVEEWNSVANTADRVRIKALAFVEEWMPELYARGHDIKEPLSAKVELLKTMSKLGGVGQVEAIGGGGERMVVQINLGQDYKLEFAKDVTPKVTSDEAAA